MGNERPRRPIRASDSADTDGVPGELTGGAGTAGHTDHHKGQPMSQAQAQRPRADTAKLLGIYLNDHLAGATGGVELARRTARGRQGSSGDGDLGRLAREIAEDRRSLLDVMRRLGVPVRRHKVIAGWAGEKAGRLKANGRVVRRSPLSSLVELEAMRLGVEGKASGWRTLRELADGDDRLDAGLLDTLIARAHDQAELLEDIRVRRAAELFRP
jgi:hypothetical protein